MFRTSLTMDGRRWCAVHITLSAANTTGWADWQSAECDTEEDAISLIRMLVIDTAREMGVTPGTFIRRNMAALSYSKRGVRVPLFDPEDGWGKDEQADMRRMADVINGR